MRFAVLAAGVAAGLSLPLAAAADRFHGPPPPAYAELALPTGSLAPIGGGVGEFAFLEVGSLQRHNGNVEALFYMVFNNPRMSVGGKMATQGVARVSVDCNSGISVDLKSEFYDDDGNFLLWLPPTPPSTTRGGAVALCRGVSVDSSRLLTGHAVGLIAGKRYLKIAADRALAQ